MELFDKSILLNIKEVKTIPFWQGVCGEIVGTFTFVFIIMATATTDFMTSETLTPSHLLFIAASIGFGLAVTIQIFGPISGAHLNPAVSLGLVLSNRTSLVRTVLYIVAQLIGAILAAVVALGLKGTEAVGGACNALQAGVTIGNGVAFEVLGTFILVTTVLASTNTKNAAPADPAFAIGTAVFVAHLIGIKYTGTSVNPARSFGPALVSGTWKDHWIFWIGPIIGSLLATVIYTLADIRGKPESDDDDENRHELTPM